MKKVHKQTEQVLLSNEENVLNELKNAYTRSLADIKKRIKELMYEIELLEKADVENETLIRSKIYQLNFQKALESQINTSMELLGQSTVNSTETFLKKMYEDGYLTQFFVINSLGIPVINPINIENLLKAVNQKVDGYKFSQRMYEDIETLSKVTKEAIESCMIQGKGYIDIAQLISNLSEATLKQAYTIARTEGRRVTSLAKVDAQTRAKELGADIVKVWDSTLDGKTRTQHQELDGQVKEIDEKFEYHGMKAKAPTLFGVPHMDINCRCISLTVPRWEVEQGFSKRDNFADTILDFDNKKQYEEFKKDFYSRENVDYMNFLERMYEEYGTKDFETILRKMSEDEYKRYSELLKANPMYKEKK